MNYDYCLNRSCLWWNCCDNVTEVTNSQERIGFLFMIVAESVLVNNCAYLYNKYGHLFASVADDEYYACARGTEWLLQKCITIFTF